MTEDLDLIFDEFRESNEKTLTHLEAELTKVRAGKASPAMLQGVMIEYYGALTPIQQVANINTMDARTLVVQPWEKPMLNDIARGIMNANLGLNPQNNGEQLIISVPPLTEERRRDLVKRAKSECENAKVGIRNHRKDAMDMIKDMKNEGGNQHAYDQKNYLIHSLTSLNPV